MKRNLLQLSYAQFIKYITYTEVKHEGSSSDESKDRTSFTQTETIEEAINLANNGWNTGIEELELEKDLIVNGTMTTQNSLVGGYVDVGLFLSGNPECMIEFVDFTEREKPEITIYIYLTYNSATDSKDALKYAKECLNIINEKNVTHAVRVVGVFGSTHQGNNEDIVEIVIKDFYDNLALNSLAFSLHPSFFRRFWFKHLETKDYWSVSYGYPLNSENKIKSTIESLFDAKGEKIILPSLQYNGWRIRKDDISYYNS